MSIDIIQSIDTVRGKKLTIKVEEKTVHILITHHAIDGAVDYGTTIEDLIESLIYPEEVVKGHLNRFVAHKKLNHHLKRIVYEYEGETVVVITFYMSHVDRYYKGGIHEDRILP